MLARLAKNVVVQGFDFAKALENIIGDYSELGRHTAIIHITPSTATRYVWTHREIQPWGVRVPGQCHQCGVLQDWLSIASDTPGGYVLQCTNEKCGWEGRKRVGERITIAVERPQNSLILHKHKSAGASWMKIPLA